MLVKVVPPIRPPAIVADSLRGLEKVLKLLWVTITSGVRLNSQLCNDPWLSGSPVCVRFSLF